MLRRSQHVFSGHGFEAPLQSVSPPVYRSTLFSQTQKGSVESYVTRFHRNQTARLTGHTSLARIRDSIDISMDEQHGY